jgi:hypothetical protein
VSAFDVGTGFSTIVKWTNGGYLISRAILRVIHANWAQMLYYSDVRFDLTPLGSDPSDILIV